MLNSYLKKIFETASRGDAREESYYSALAELLQNYAESTEKKRISVTTLPKKTEAGNPDFRVWDGKQHIVGYIEAKEPGTEYLNEIEEKEQLKRYLNTFPNLILTNFLEFRLYRDGNLIDKVSISRPFIARLGLKKAVEAENEEDFFKLLEKYFSFSLPKVYSAKSLAKELAKRTRFLRDEVITQELKEEEANGSGFISGFYEAFKQYLIADLTQEEFADLYAQTVTYGLFAARTRADSDSANSPSFPPLEKSATSFPRLEKEDKSMPPFEKETKSPPFEKGGKGGFNRKLAYDFIPHTIGVLRDIFRFISMGELPPQMEWIIDDISDILAVTDVSAILHKYFHEGKGKDPIVHFYETFLAEYDPKTREKRGVYYTPEPVVSYIVRSIHQILKGKFGKEDGVAGSSVTLLDPAAGTLTFLAEAAKIAVDAIVPKYGSGTLAPLMRERILENFYAFELMMAPYAIGHLKIAFLLEELGYKLKEDERFKLYLTNTLEMDELPESRLPGMHSLSEESHEAGIIKREKPILVIMGNPPYSGHSFNKGEWISTEIKEYYKVDGHPLNEKQPKWLQDDYVKFIRFAQWKIDQAGEGILGFITNHSYLDNPTFRGMRQSLMNSFDEMYILDLHGNSLKKEVCPDGSKDENVFDIRQGVAIALFIKEKEPVEEPIYRSPQRSLFEKEPKPKKPKKHKCKVSYAEIWGLREQKYDWLLKNGVKSTKWKRLAPRSEFYLFIPRDEELLNAYENFPRITEIFPVNSVGIVTARDNLTIKWTNREIWSTVQQFSRMDTELARKAFDLGKDTSNWKVGLAQKDLINSGPVKTNIQPILYRPFDTRYTYFTGNSGGFICRPIQDVMVHMMQNNLGLIANRQVRTEKIHHSFVTNKIMDFHVIETAHANPYLFPLYLYSENKQEVSSRRSSVQEVNLLGEKTQYQSKKPNLSNEIMKNLSEAFNNPQSPEAVLFYIYGVLYSDIYRSKYAEFMKTDFPRVPFTKDFDVFQQMAKLGQKLVELHLMKSPEVDEKIARFRGENKIDKVIYDEKDQRLYVNSAEYFEGIPKEIYEYHIGGYQICHKWLKDRKGRKLSLEDIQHYCKIVTAISKTIETQKEIDALYPEVEKDIIEFKNNW